MDSDFSRCPLGVLKFPETSNLIMNSAFNFKSARTHDSFYADQNLSEPKESFIAILNLIQKKYSQSSVNLIDIGCACGDFPGFLSKASGLNVCGMDSLPLLISQARIRYPGVQFIEGSILDKSALPDNSYEIITVLGVLSIFDDLTSICMNLSNWIKSGGTILFMACSTQIQLMYLLDISMPFMANLEGYLRLAGTSYLSIHLKNSFWNTVHREWFFTSLTLK